MPRSRGRPYSGIGYFCAQSLGLVLCACTALGCDEPVTQVVVEVRADTLSRQRARHLRILVRTSAQEVRFDQTADVSSSAAIVKFPTTVPIVPLGGDPKRTFRFTAELFDEKQVLFNRAESFGSFVAEEIVRRRISLIDPCIDVLCDEGLTCIDGECAPIPALTSNFPEKPSDNQQGACLSGFCYEYPRPWGIDSTGACLWDETSGLVVGKSAAVLKLENGYWVPELSGKLTTLRDVACFGDQQAVAVGDNGEFRERSAQGWASLPNVPTLPGEHITAVDLNSAGEGWAIGTKGGLYARKGGTWSRIDIGLTGEAQITDLYNPSIMRREDGTALLTFGNALIETDGTTYQTVGTPPGNALGQVQGPSSQRFGLGINLTGAKPTFHEYNAGAWSATTIQATTFGIGNELAIIGGGRGDVSVRTAVSPGNWSAWKATSTFADGSELRAAAVRGKSAIIAGSVGSLAHYHQGKWKAKWVLGAPGAFRDLGTHPSINWLATVVGEGGLLLVRGSDGIWRRRIAPDGALPTKVNLNGVWLGKKLSVVVGATGKLFESADFSNWLPVTTPGATGDLLVVDGYEERVAVAETTGKIYERIAGQWIATSGPNAGATITSIAVLPKERIAVTTATEELYLRDGGKWNSIPNFPARAVQRGTNGVLWFSSGREIYTMAPGSAPSKYDIIFDPGTSPIVDFSVFKGQIRAVVFGTRTSCLIEVNDSTRHCRFAKVGSFTTNSAATAKGNVLLMGSNVILSTLSAGAAGSK